MENTPEDKVDTPQEVQNPSRRRLLKFLAAGGAVTAVTMLPGKWSSPSIKTGVLPAHAQVTPAPTATPVPDEYMITCADDGQIGEGNPNPIYTFSATAWNNTTNQPAAGVLLKASLDVDDAFTVQTKTTDANGIALFDIAALYPQFADAVATVTFDDQVVYGTDSCQTIFRVEF